MINENEMRELLRVRNGRLFHREGQELEFKARFNLANLADYYRDFAAFANNRGGYLVFGVKDSPRKLVGLSGPTLEQWEKLDPERVTGHLIELFSPSISWDMATIHVDSLAFAVFRVFASHAKPVIARRDEGAGPVLRSGDIYYRYGGRTQRIQYSELESIIAGRIEANNGQWMDLMSKISKAGPQNAAILDTERSLIQKNDATILVVDEALASKLKFIKEGEFDERDGAETLKLVGDVVPVDSIEVIKRVKETLTKAYPFSARELANEVKEQCPTASEPRIWSAIADNGMKDNPAYSAYNFRSKSQEDRFRFEGTLPGGTPSLYNQAAVDFVVQVLSEGGE